jgi:UDP-N-acetylmuramyl pentapeptide synthase
VNGVAFDSREVMEGDLFLALRGETADGHRFLGGAFGKGAAAALVEHPVLHPMCWWTIPPPRSMPWAAPRDRARGA